MQIDCKNAKFVAVFGDLDVEAFVFAGNSRKDYTVLTKTVSVFSDKIHKKEIPI